MSSSSPLVRNPVSLIVERLQIQVVSEKYEQTAHAIIGALDQNGWSIVRKRHMRNPK